MGSTGAVLKDHSRKFSKSLDAHKVVLQSVSTL